VGLGLDFNAKRESSELLPACTILCEFQRAHTPTSRLSLVFTFSGSTCSRVVFALRLDLRTSMHSLSGVA